jgi:Domain of Unknown Function (DUF1206)
MNWSVSLFKTIWGYGCVTERAKNPRRRAGGAFQAVIFVVPAVLAGGAAAGAGSGSSGKASATDGVFGLPGGRYIVGAVGIGIPAVGVVKIVRGWQTKSIDEMDLPPHRSARQLTVRLGQIGSIAKGASIGQIGALVVIAAIRFRPEEASGLDAALKALAAQPYGCLPAHRRGARVGRYGVFCFFDARYHRV